MVSLPYRQEAGAGDSARGFAHGIRIFWALNGLNDETSEPPLDVYRNIPEYKKVSNLRWVTTSRKPKKRNYGYGFFSLKQGWVIFRLSFTVKFYAHIATGGFSVLALIRFPYEVVNGSSSKEVEPGTSIQQEIKSIPGIIFKKQQTLFTTTSLWFITGTSFRGQEYFMWEYLLSWSEGCIEILFSSLFISNCGLTVELYKTLSQHVPTNPPPKYTRWTSFLQMEHIIVMACSSSSLL